MTSNQLCSITIIRPARYADYFRRYRILCDGAEVGRIAAKSTLRFDVTSGPHDLEARIDWARSEPLRFDSTSDRALTFEVANNWSPLGALWAISLARSHYLKLRRLE